MASLQSKTPARLDQHGNKVASSMTREDLMLLAQSEYARQLCNFTKTQLMQKVPCYTDKHKLGKENFSSVKAAQQ
ncbi:hypothetical protein BDF20DRAFT_884628 [Mycotypha africana]|uniref:uncharacterized protein n=1 Tax=Mycotypha africana TaxID=64632 RepID=UPI0023009061|nr:uncharacterized protein BDF20DRAFT_884628 [Mycotypha africana]KAI8971463.1 hypothetical protein BDF20DRAFT_884628 [Mycotypha africana]